MEVRPERAIHAFKVEQPWFFDAPEIVDLFTRAFTGENARFEVHPDEARTYAQQHISEPGHDGADHWLNFWTVHHEDAGFCGFMMMSYAPWPMCPNVCLAHFHCERADCREPMLTKAFAWAYSLGLTKVSITNFTLRSDAAHMRLFRKFGKGNVVGSLIVYDLEDRV